MPISSSWAEVTIGQYQAMTAIIAKNLSDIEQRLEFAELFVGDSCNDWTVSKLKEETDKLSFTNHLPSEKMVYGFEIDGKEYLINPLVQTLKAGQFIDLSELLNNPAEINNQLHNIMAVISVEKGKSYESYIENGKLFQSKLTMDKVYPVSVFFLQVGKRYLEIINGFLKKETKKAERELKKLQKELGIKHSTNTGAGV